MSAVRCHSTPDRVLLFRSVLRDGQFYHQAEGVVAECQKGLRMSQQREADVKLRIISIRHIFTAEFEN